MAPSGPCSRGMPKAEVWTWGKRIEPVPIPNMLCRPGTADKSPAKSKTIDYKSDTKCMQRLKLSKVPNETLENQYFRRST